MTPRKLAGMTPGERSAKVAELTPVWARDYIRQLEDLTRTLHRQLTEARRQGSEIRGVSRGITAPQEGYATIRALDGAANMEPLADLPENAEIRFADWYQVRYGTHETTAGARVLVIEGDGPLLIRPAGPSEIIITKG